MNRLIQAGLTIALIGSFGCGGGHGGGGGGGQGLPTTVTVVTAGNQTMVLQGLSLVITAGVMHTHGGSTGVTWSLSGANCPNNCGSLSSNNANPVTYTAPQTVSASFMVTVTATADADTTKTASVVLTIEPAPCPAGNETVLNGQYAFLLQGSFQNSVVAVAGSFSANGAGSITGGLEDVNRSFGGPEQDLTILPQASSYSVGSDNRGCLTLVNSNNEKTIYRFALGSLSAGVATKGRIIEFDDSSGTGTRAEGIIRKQDPTSFSPNGFQGNYVFGWVGVDLPSHARTVRAGVVNAKPGLFQSGTMDTNDGGAVSSATVTGGGIGVGANGRGTLVFNLASGSGPGHVFYMVSTREIITMALPGSAPIQTGEFFQQVLSTFNDSALNGNALGYASGVLSGSAGTDVSIGLVTASGTGSFTGVLDINNAGTFVPLQSVSGTYSVGTNGRTTITGLGSNSPIVYLTNTNTGVSLGTGPTADFGYFEPQVGGPFSNTSLSGIFFLGTESASAASRPITSGSLTFDGVGNYTGSEDASTPTGLTANQVLNNTYSFLPSSSPPGRGTLDSGSNTVAYIISPSKLVFLDKSVAMPSLTVVEK